MSLRLVLICLAIWAVAYAQPAPGAPQEDIESSLALEGTLVAPMVEAKPRTLVLLLPLLFPDQFYST